MPGLSTDSWLWCSLIFVSAWFAINAALGVLPYLGDRIYGPWGAAIDVFAIVCTTFGISTSLGLGVEQLSTGLNYLFGVPESGGLKLAITVAIMAMAAVS
jgi:choline-glycine betaine transporter